MRNLKRALSLALASVMVLGLMVVGSGASYADVTSEENQEAIEVLQAVGVMVGDDEGNFNPDKNVTRNEMAVIMANLLDLKVEDFNAADIPFTDVPSWAVSYVAACYADGITSGTSATTYGGNNTVTAAQAALMMMKALGYFQNQGDFEQDWTLATIKQGSEIGIFKGVTVDRVSPLTRNDVAQMALNALKAKMVDFTGEVGMEIPTAGGQTIVVGYNPEYTYKTSSERQYDRIDDVASTIGNPYGQYYVQLGEYLYDGDLQLRADTDVFGRPARYWEYDGKEIGTYVNEELMIAEYTTKVTGETLYDLLTRNTVINYDIDVVIDGEYEAPTGATNYWFTKNAINRNNDATVGGTGNGVLTQVFVDNDRDVVTIAIINTYLAIADDDYNEKRDEASLTVYGIDKTTGGTYFKETINGQEDSESMDVSAEDFLLVEDILADDAYLVTVADGEIQTMAAAEVISGTEIQSFETGSVYTGATYSKSAPSTVEIDGTEYKFATAAEYDPEVMEYYTNSNTGTTNLKDITYNVYLDAYGYAIGVEELESPDNYLFVTGIDLNGSNLTNRTADANVIFLDGTMATVEINMGKSDFMTLSNDDKDAILNTWCTYTVNSNDVYTVKEIPNVNIADSYAPNGTNNKNGTLAQYNATIAGASNVIEIDDRHISVEGKSGSGTFSRIYGTDDTVYLTVSLAELENGGTHYGVIDDVDSVATGIGNVSLEAWSTEDAQGKAEDDDIGDADDLSTGTVTITTDDGSVIKNRTSNGVYSLYDDNGDIIAAVVVGEDAGSTKNLVYVHSSSVFKETYNKADDQWTWSRKVISNGQEVVLTEVGDGLSELGEMDQHKWYQVKYDADGNVVSADVASAALLGANGYVTDYEDIDDAVDVEDDVLYTSLAPEIHSEDLELRGRTLWLDTDLTKGFRVAEDVNVALIQWNNNTENTYFDSGVKSLESIVDDLNDRHYDNSEGDTEHDYVISAIIERGVATSVVIWDKSRICDPYSDPDWGTSDLEDVYKVELDVTFGPYNHHVVPFFMAGSYDEDVAVDAIYQELVDLGYEVLDVIDNGADYTFQTKRGVVSKDFTWKVGYYENVYAVGNVTCDEVTSGAPASVNVKYLVPGETVTFTYDRGDTWVSGSYSTASFTVGGQTVSNDTPVTINGEVATTTFTVPDSIANGDVVCDSIDA